MKQIITVFISLALFFIIADTSAQDTNNVVLEVTTGTWCQWCPCGHVIAEQIAQTFPNVLVMEYHGPTGSDPFANFNGNEIIPQVFMTAGYPSGAVGRRSGIIDRGSWVAQVYSQLNSVPPGVRLVWVKNYNAAARQLNVTVDCTALQNLTGDYFLNFVIMENNVIYSQTGNGSCTGGANYVHMHLVRDMINSSLGEALNTGGVWNANQVITKTLNYTVSNSWVADNCDFACFVYKQLLPLASAGYIMQSKKQSLIINTTGIQNTGTTIPASYKLEQNYPNPFNPNTNIIFSIPKKQAVTFKIYDVIGNEASVILNDAEMPGGTYNVSFDASGLSSGIYFYRLTSKDFTATKKMILIK